MIVKKLLSTTPVRVHGVIGFAVAKCDPVSIRRPTRICSLPDSVRPIVVKIVEPYGIIHLINEPFAVGGPTLGSDIFLLISIDRNCMSTFRNKVKDCESCATRRVLDHG